MDYPLHSAHTKSASSTWNCEVSVRTYQFQGTLRGASKQRGRGGQAARDERGSVGGAEWGTEGERKGGKEGDRKGSTTARSGKLRGTRRNIFVIAVPLFALSTLLVGVVVVVQKWNASYDRLHSKIGVANIFPTDLGRAIADAPLINTLGLMVVNPDNSTHRPPEETYSVRSWACLSTAWCSSDRMTAFIISLRSCCRNHD